MTYKALAALAVLALAGCQGGGIGRPGSPAWNVTTSPEQQAAYYRKQCVNYGFKPGTVEMAQCVQMEAVSTRNRASARAARMSQIMANSAPQRPVSTTCNRFGSTVNCTSF